MRFPVVIARSCLAALLAAPFALHAEPPKAVPEPAATAEASADEDKPVCKRDPVLGSRLPGPKVCMTARQWKARNTDAQDATRRVQANSRSLEPG